MQINNAGIAIAKSNEIDFALVVSPDFFNCAIKKLIASYNGTPWNPGKIVCLLLSEIKVTGVELIMILLSLVTKQF